MGKWAPKNKGKSTPKPADRTEGPDFGDFTIGHPNEDQVFAQLWELAHKNTQVPGTAHVRLIATHPDSDVEIGKKYYHLDINKHTLVVLEEKEGKVVARRTMELPAASDEVDDRPPLIVPGPEELAFERRPFAAADLDIDDELREWAMGAIDRELAGAGAVITRVRLFRNGTMDTLEPAQPLLPANIARLGATLRSLRLRPGVQRAMVQGWFDAGEAMGLAFVFEPCGGEDWWFANRMFRRKAGPIGEWTGGWQAIEGTGPAGLPMAARALRWVLPAAEAYDAGEPVVPEPQSVRIAGGEMARGEVLPTTAEGVAERVARAFESDVISGKPAHAPRAVVFRGRKWERWDLDGDLPTDIDDVLRVVARSGPEPEALVLVQFGIVPVEGSGLVRCLMTVAERGGERFCRTMEIRTDSQGKVTATRYLLGKAKHLDGELWIGVEPISPLGILSVPPPKGA